MNQQENMKFLIDMKMLLFFLQKEKGHILMNAQALI